MAITSGGGAAAVVVDIVNAMWDNAKEQTNNTSKLVQQAIGYADPAPKMDQVEIAADFNAPDIPQLPVTDPNEGERIYDTKRREMETLVASSFSGFLSTYLPISPSLQYALDWLGRAINVGGSGINAAVEAALWQRDRGRILADSERAADEAMATWANRGFPLPPGALTNQVNQINLDAGRKLAESSRTAAIESFKAELENVRFAVKEAIDYRTAAINAAGDYIKTMMLGPQTAMQLATGLANLKNDLARTLVSFYTAQNTAAEIPVRLAIAQGELSARVGQANLEAEKGSVDAKVRAGIAGAQMAASQASAGINGVNGQASISGSDSSQV